MTNFYSLKDFADGPHMVVDPRGKWAWAADLAAARSEIERLTVERDFFLSEVKLRNRIPSTNDTAADLLRRAEKAEAERDEAQAQVAILLEVAASMSVDGEVDIPPIIKHLILSLTPAHAQAALEAYGREKMRKGMQRAANIAEQCWESGYGYQTKEMILAEMAKLK